MAKKSKSKLTKYAVLHKSPALAGTLPNTRLFSKRSLYKFLDRYKKVIAKPASGSGGAGVILITGRRHSKYRVQRGTKSRTTHGKKETYRYLRKKVKSSYLVQRGISLARIHGSPFDVRVMVQRKPGEAWVVTGMLAKVAGRGYIITNVKRSGGKVLPLATAIRCSTIKGTSGSAIMACLRRVALLAAHRLAGYYTKQRFFGLDMGIDSSGKVWIIEANLRPDITLFLKLADKTMYHTIVSYRK
ncbi:hypothetical protein J31TS6_50810 [Brevibacillus reuszeri]|uniref:YheC/YheD family protein n=1 Tax=Brevibacillus reuszeri TaxID=54915 RepID=UPI001B197E8E|nr:YheC/YheD family protein [Brevibacillus reuszeri]GIO09053.1 hypothetical protein J31TS6_50810 [Brevibacillus reuszeri]